MMCGQGSLVNRGRHAFRAFNLMCRCWSCDNCRPMRSRQLADLALSGKPTTFLTLTSDPKTGGTPDTRAQRMARAFPILMRRAAKKAGRRSIPYLRVFEATKRDEPHIHALLRAPYIPQEWLSEQWQDLTRAYIVHIKMVTDWNKVAAYVSKYLGKDPRKFERCKRYVTTQDWRLPAEDEERPDPTWSDCWYVTKWTLAVLAAGWKQQGYDVAMEDGVLIAMARGPPEGPGDAYV